MVSRGLPWSPVVSCGLLWSPVVSQLHFPERYCKRMPRLSRNRRWGPFETRGRQSWSPVVSRGLPWSPVVSRGLPWSPSNTFRSGTVTGCRCSPAVSCGVLWKRAGDYRGLLWSPVVSQQHFSERHCNRMSVLCPSRLWDPLETRRKQPVTNSIGLAKARTPSAKRCLGNKRSEAVKQGSERGGERATRASEASPHRD